MVMTKRSARQAALRPIVSAYMNLDGVAGTALWTAAARARESLRADRLFDDPFADDLAGAEGTALLARFHTAKAAPEGNPFLAIRTRWFDDFVRSAVTAGDQVVGLGAGLDTRAHRLPWPADVAVYELDHEAVLVHKRRTLRRLGARPRCAWRPVAVDLSGEWPKELHRAGFDPARRTVWFAEGLLFYLPEETAGTVLHQAAGVSAPGSVLAADLIGTAVFHLPYTRSFLRSLETAGSPWRFGTDNPVEFIERFGWRVTQATEPGRAEANYGRWPADAAPTNISGLPRSHLLAASVDRDGRNPCRI
ncbi:SAM-dependent methyltransferase [Nonomuraea insulae]|uniref:S-adenosyl-L-methionine-dependent methyltransferase n=1 Tax=Nonomuraea insulae TaxID=1616787 RepID=A0ABW1D9L7_9ACTN